MILTHGLNSISRGGGEDFVEIGGRKYPAVKIGDKMWTTENLDYKWDGLVLNTDPVWNPTQAAWYKNEELYGIAYNHNAMLKIIEDLPSGWRIPTPTDLTELTNYSSESLRSTTGWSTAGTNSTGFNALPSGYWSRGWFEVNNAFRLDAWDETKRVNFIIYLNQIVVQRLSLSWTPTTGFPVRLVRDV